MMPEDSLVGKTIANYKILQELGRGGMGVVYKAHETTLDRLVALKVLPLHISNDAAFVKRFEREARFAASLSHPNIVAIHAVGKEECHHFIVMEYVRGKTLSRLLHEAGRLSVQRALQITLSAAEALAEAHKLGMVHRDIKPDNIMIDESGRVKVMDFGLARGIHSTTELTAKGAVLGTPRYMSPEQCEGHKPDHRTDLYSLGIVLFEMLTGITPYAAETPLALMRHIVESPLPAIQEISADVAPHVCAIVYKMTAKRPEDRYDSAEAVADDIRALVESGDSRQLLVPSSHSDGDKTRRLSVSTPLTPLQALPAYRRMAWGVLVLAALALIGIGAGLAFWLSGGDPEEPATGPLRAQNGTTGPAVPTLRPPSGTDTTIGEERPPPGSEGAPIPVLGPAVSPGGGLEPAVTDPGIVPEGLPRRVEFPLREVVLDPLNPEQEVAFTVTPDSADPADVSWYAGGPISVRPQNGSILVRTTEIAVGLGEEQVYKVFARLEDYGVDLGSLDVRLRNPVAYVRFKSTPSAVMLGPSQESERVAIELTGAGGVALDPRALSFTLTPGDAPLTVERETPQTLLVQLAQTETIHAQRHARLDALLRGERVGGLQVTILPTCVISGILFGTEEVTLSNTELTREVYFEPVPSDVGESVLDEVRFESNDARVLISRISPNVLEVSLDPSAPLIGGQTQSREVSAWYCGREVGTLAVELVPFSDVPAVSFAVGAVRLSNQERTATVPFEITPADAPQPVLDAISFRSDSPAVTVDRDEPRAVRVALRDSVTINGPGAQLHTVTAWYEGKVLASVSVELVPYRDVPEVKFPPGPVRLTNEDRRILVSFEVRSAGTDDTALDSLRFRSDREEILVSRLDGRRIEVALGPFVRLNQGDYSEGLVTAHYGDVPVGEMKVLLSGPSPIERVEARPEKVELSSTAPTAYVEIGAIPDGVSEQDLEHLEFVLDDHDPRITWRRTRSNALIVSMTVSAFDPGEKVGRTLRILAGGKPVGSLRIDAIRPAALEEVSFIPSSVALTPDQPGARVSFTTNPAGMSIEELEWYADPPVGVRYLGERMIEVFAPTAAFREETRAELRVSARLQGEPIGTLTVTLAGRKLPTYQSRAFGPVSVTYPARLRAGERALVEVAGANWLPAVQDGEIVVSLEGRAPRVPESAGGDYEVVEAGVAPLPQFSEVQREWRELQQGRLVQGTRVGKGVSGWVPRAQHVLRFPVTFGQTGIAQIFVRVSFLRVEGRQRVIMANMPEWGTADQQGLPCEVFEVTVVE